MDLVGYSKLPTDQQRELLKELNKIVREIPQFKQAEAASKLIRLPTGDGMALAFFTNPEAALKCAIEISKAVGQALPPAGEKRGQAGALALPLRMGLHSGPVSGVTDVNDRSNVAGVGINLAQRVMDCGDAGHILLSSRIADDLAQQSRWRPSLHELGAVEVKHGVRMEVVNFYDEQVGNPEVPEKIKRAREEQSALDHRASRTAARKRSLVIGLLLLLVVVGIAGSRLLFHRVAPRSTKPISLSIPDKSIAVLPLENLSEEKENAFFADGIQDDILTSLAKIGDLKVISRTSVLQYRGAGAARNLRDIALALGVANILEGSVRRVGDRVLVNVQLIDARNDRHIWAERYDRTIVDSIGIQGELAIEIAGALQAKLAPEEQTRLDTKPTNNPEAYLLYLKALERERMVNASTEDKVAAERLYVQATTFDPKFALAYARASLLNSAISFGPSDRDKKAKARAQAEEAVRLAPTLGDAHLALGLCLYWADKNYSGALKEFAIAAAASPNNAEVLHYIAGIYRRQGRWRESLACYERAQPLDPRNGKILSYAAVDYMLVRDWPSATASYNRALEISPDSVFPEIALAYLEIYRNGTPTSAKQILQKIPTGVDPDGAVTEAKWDVAMLQRDFDSAEKILNDYAGPDFPADLGWPKSFSLGQVALARGDAVSGRRFFMAAAPKMETWERDHSDDLGVHDQLGLLYAYMGRKEDALREARHTVEMEPESQNAYFGAGHVANLAMIYALAGDADQAIPLIERLLTTPGPVGWTAPGSITLADLRLRWEWDLLRKDPRFQKILAGPEPKTVY
jgi:TolB-like protein/Tfp pilus assembly protein PilF